MRNLLALTAFLVLTFAVVGWCRDWYHIRPSTPSEDGHQSISIDVNRRKIVHDVHQGEKEIHQAIDKGIAEHQRTRHDDAQARDELPRD